MDKQMIEEMAKLVQVDMCGDVPCEECNYHGKMKILPKYCGTYLIAEKLYNAGYRKIPENAVVLTREEYDEIKQYQSYIPEMKKAFDKVSKATAEKFAKMAKERKIEMGTDGHSYCMVFVEDIDEICKEITEGKH